MKVLVIGAGAAGMMAAISAAQNNAKVIIAEKNERVGKKLFITGKGRCNITNSTPDEEFFDNVVTNSKFLYSAVYSFDSEAVCSFLENEGLKIKEERGKRIFPVSDKSSDVIKTLEKALKKNNVEIRLNCRITDVVVNDGIFLYALTSSGEKIYADSVIIATGGLSYRSTGSTGDGLTFAQKTGHRIIPALPSLVPLTVKEPFIRELEGLSLKNVSIKMDRYTDFGEMLFTSDGVSGPLILSASAFLCKKIESQKNGLTLHIDLKPALTKEQLDARILRDFSDNINKDFRNSLVALLPSKMIPVIVSLSKIPYNKKVNEITRQERNALAELLKDFRLTVTGTKGFEQAVITQGGVCVKDIDPATCMSKIIKNMFFAGEVIDVDAYTGGFNLQIAWSTGHLAGENAAQR